MKRTYNSDGSYTEEWVIEHTWVCSSCKSDNKGREKKCDNCGAPKDNSDKEIIPDDMSESKAITDEKLINQFKAGADWICSYCNHHETNLFDKCSECAASKAQKKGNVEPEVFEVEGTRPLRSAVDVLMNPPAFTPWKCERCGIQNYTIACETCRFGPDIPGATQISPGMYAVNKTTSIFAPKNNIIKGEKITSMPGAAIKVTQIELSDEMQRGLCTSVLKLPESTVMVGSGYRATSVPAIVPPPWYQSIVDVYRGIKGTILDKRKVVAIVLMSILGVIGFVWLMWYLFAPHEIDAKVISTRWSYLVMLRQRRIDHGHDWRGNMHIHNFNVSCHSEIRSYHNCNPYQCNPHQESYQCNCRSVQNCTTTTSCSTSCSNNSNGSSTCSRSCSPERSCSTSTSCDTCYRTAYDTCYHRCPDYDDLCDYDYPSWAEVNRANLSDTNHTIVRPNLRANTMLSCPSDPEELFLKHHANQCTEDHTLFVVNLDAGKVGHWTYQPTNLQDYNRFQAGTYWRVEYNRAGSFKPLRFIQ